MTIYILGMILTFFLTYFYTKYQSSFKKKFVFSFGENKKFKLNFDIVQFIPMIPLVLISGIRYGVGQDYFYTYVPIFEKVLRGDTQNVWGDIGYIYLNKFVQLFTDHYSGIFILTSFLFIFFVFKTIYTESDNKPLSTFLLVSMGYYFCSMNGIRQMLATSILMYSIKHIKENNLLRFLICLLFASLIHLSAVIFIIVYLLRNKNVGKNTIVFSVVFVFATSGIISKLLLYIVGLTKYSWYLDSSYNAERVGFIMIIINILILIFALIFNRDRKNDIYIKLQWLAVLSTAFIGKIPVANRIQWIFGLPSIILIPNVLKDFNSKKQRIFISSIIIIVYFIYFLYTIGVKNSNNVLPYYTIFD